MSFKKGHSKEQPLPQEQVEMMAALWVAGELTASQVAYRLNVTFGTKYTRSAVLGKVRRLKLPLRQPRRTRITAPVEPKVVVVLPPPPPPPEPTPPPEPLCIPLIDAERSMCRWMMTDTTICGVTKKSGSSFCEHHHKRAYVKPSRRAA